MMLHLKQKVGLSYMEMPALIELVREFVYQPVMPGFKLSMFQVLAMAHLRKLLPRLENKFAEPRKKNAATLEMKMSREELLALYGCFPVQAFPDLLISLGAVHQKVLNLDAFIEIN